MQQQMFAGARVQLLIPETKYLTSDELHLALCKTSTGPVPMLSTAHALAAQEGSESGYYYHMRGFRKLLSSAEKKWPILVPQITSQHQHLPSQ
jgi:hypothetical protein